MGHFSHNCKLTGLPITSGKAVLIVMKPQENLWDNSEVNLKKYGKTYLCSNNGPRLKYIPCWYPIMGNYSGYGGFENIVHDDNTKILEEYYGLAIEDLVDIVTSSRKDDGYDDVLSKIKKKPIYPDDWVEGEEHFDRYQRLTGDKSPFDGNYPSYRNDKYKVYRDGKMVLGTRKEYDDDLKLIQDHYKRYEIWKKTNPDYGDDYGNPQYEEKYKELLTFSGMWVHGDLYEELTKNKIEDQWRDGLDLGTPQLLTALGFKELLKRGKGRYNRKFEKDGLIINSDGTWLEIPNEHVYRLKDLKKYCEKKGVHIDIEELDEKDHYEQIYDYVIPTFKTPGTPKPINDDIVLKYKSDIESALKETEDDDIKEMLRGILDNEDEIINILEHDNTLSLDNSHLGMNVYRMFLNTEDFGRALISNPLTPIYMEKAKEGKLRENIVRFWRFDQYMFACGKYYDIVGTGPQDGEHKMVLKVLKTATSILKKHIKKYHEDDE